MNGGHNEHVKIIHPTEVSGNFSDEADKFLGSLLLISSLIGVFGNTLAVYHFLTTKIKKVPTILFIAISCVDLCTCLSGPPVAFTWLNLRRPGFWNSPHFCFGWHIFFTFMLRMSMFLAMMMSLTRAIFICFPLRQQEKKIVATISFAYIILLLLHDALNGSYVSTIEFTTDGPYCHWSSSPKATSRVKLANYTILSCETGIPPIITFLSFTASIVKLNLKSSVASTGSGHRNSKATKTITLFTIIFLLCNLPYFTLNVLDTLTSVFYSYPGPLFSGPFMTWYSWAVAKVLFTGLNAVVNPVLYFWRMKKFRDGILEIYKMLIRWTARGPSNSVASCNLPNQSSVVTSF